MSRLQAVVDGPAKSEKQLAQLFASIRVEAREQHVFGFALCVSRLGQLLRSSVCEEDDVAAPVGGVPLARDEAAFLELSMVTRMLGSKGQ